MHMSKKNDHELSEKMALKGSTVPHKVFLKKSSASNRLVQAWHEHEFSLKELEISKVDTILASL